MTFFNKISRINPAVPYGILLAVLVFILKWLQWEFLIIDNTIEIYTGLLALFFTLLGLWTALQFAKPQIRTLLVEKEIFVERSEDFVINTSELKKLSLSSREYEVLQLLAKGHSNAEIAGQLFLSLSTIKTHVSSLFVKMEVKSRAKAIEKSKRLKITP